MPAAHGAARVRRLAALLGVTVAGASLLCACSKPVPQVTFASGPRSVLVAPQQYCFTTVTSSCRTGGAVRELSARAGGDILISVPREVSGNAWVATAYTRAQDGSNSPVQGAGSNLIVDAHDARVFVPLDAGSYLLTVSEVRGQRQTGAWTIRVAITA